jgi:CheY-like chemotaxis protein
MNGILGITDLLLESSREPETLSQLKLLRECGDSMLALLNDILDFKKLESGKLVLDPHPFDPKALIRSLADVHGKAAAAKGLDFKLVEEGLPGTIEGDATRIRQILANLLSNAVKFTHAGAVELSARFEAGEGDKARLIFAVRDEGIGIPDSALSRLFLPYTQVDASTTRRYGGTGLGLAIVRGLAHAMGGEAVVASEPGKGSTFTVSIECRKSTAAPVPPEPSWTPVVALPLSILVAEDNRVSQVVILKQLDRLGCKVDLAADGKEAVALASSKKYDVILMDCQMPEMDGFQAAETILKAPRRGAPPIILALTAGLMQEEKARCRACGMSAVLEKPMRLEALRAALLAASRSAEATPLPEPRPK